MRTAIERVKARGGTVSFDPNSRKELPRGSELAAFVDFVIDASDIVLPSGPELLFLTGAKSEKQAIAALIRRGVGRVVVKRGAKGASHFDRNGATHVAPIPVEELDPTGAGDCFGATFVVCWLRGMSIGECLRYANASGAHKVLFKGPMEGVAGFAELDAWLAGAARAMSGPWLAALPEHRRLGEVRGLTSVCSAHPWVIEAALAAPGEAKVLIEATCNQVNQEGGYTGMTPADFRGFVERNRASRAGFPRDAPHPRRRSPRPQSVEASGGGGSDAAGGGDGRGLCRGGLRENPSRRQHGLPRRACGARRRGRRGARGTPCGGRRADGRAERQRAAGLRHRHRGAATGRRHSIRSTRSK